MTLTKWVVTVVTAALVALGGITLAEKNELLKETAAKVEDIKLVLYRLGVIEQELKEIKGYMRDEAKRKAEPVR